MSKKRKILVVILCIAVAVCLTAVIGDIIEDRQAFTDYKSSISIAGLDSITFDEETEKLTDTYVEESSFGTESETELIGGYESLTETESETKIETEAETAADTEKVSSGDKVADALAAVDLEALKAVNPDVIGWIMIPKSALSYPLLKGEDNSYYLNHTWSKAKNSSGSIYMDYRCNRDLSDFNTIIYGHRMNNESMFGSLKFYSSKEHLKYHSYVYVVTENSVKKYAVFSVYEADVENGHSYRLGLKDEFGKQAYINYCLENSIYDCGHVPSTDTNIITLSTCTKSSIYDYKTRWVIHAAFVEEIPK